MTIPANELILSPPAWPRLLLVAVLLTSAFGCQSGTPPDEPAGLSLEVPQARIKAQLSVDGGPADQATAAGASAQTLTTPIPPTISETVTVTQTKTITDTTTGTGTHTTTGTATVTRTATGTSVVTAQGTFTLTYTGTKTGTLTSSGAVSGTKTATGTASWTGTYLGTGTATGTRTTTGTLSGTATVTGRLTLTATGTKTNTGTTTGSATSTASASATQTLTYTTPATATNTTSSTSTRTSTATATLVDTIANPCVGSWAFCDNFESGTGAWNVRQGPVQNFTIIGDVTKVYSEGDPTASQLYISQAGGAWMDSTVEASLKPLSFSSATASSMVALWGHYDSTWGADCGYYVALRGDGKVALGKRVAGVDSVLGTPVSLSGGISAGVWYDVKLDMVATTLKAYVNGTLLLTQTDTSCDAGSTGVGSLGASFETDNVRVIAPTTNTCVQDWRNTTCGAFCTYEAGVQSDRAGCGVYLDCYANNGCSPETCGGQDDVCGVNVLNSWGTASKIVADQVYKCLGCRGSIDCANRKYAMGTTCADGNPCTWTDSCLPDGTCGGSNPTTCYASDQCHDIGTCDTTTGQCGNPAKSDGAGCNDQNACTQKDECQSGVCKGLNPITCPMPAECQTQGICDATTGLCGYSAKADGSSCEDGKPCTTGDLCQSGRCVGGPLASCDDGDSCTTDSCDQVAGCRSKIVNTEACILAESSGVSLVTPFVNCVADLGPQPSDSTGRHLYSVIFGYTNAAGENLSIPAGDNNKVTANSFVVANLQPTWFQAGQKNGAFAVTHYPDPAVTWTVLGVSVSGNASGVSTCTVNSDGTVDLGGGDSLTVDTLSQLNHVIDTQILPTNNGSEAGTPGRTEGGFSVDDNGAATYQVPLWVPPAFGAVQPHLALAYNSSGGDGLAGDGWSVSGLSAISRCPQDYARDKVASSIQFSDSTDKLCLDGQRLVLVNGSQSIQYNQAGAEYRPETDRSLKIVQVGADSSGPTGFLVYTADGMRMSYGYDANSTTDGFSGQPTSVLEGYRAKVFATSNTADNLTVKYADSGEAKVRLSWAVASVSDRFGNQAVYTYFNSQTADNGYAIIFRPQTISWGYSQIGFAYQTRQYPHTYYVSGLPLNNDGLLSKITSQTEYPKFSRLLRSYSLGYQEDVSRVFMKTLTECDGAGVCKPSTRFDPTPSDPEFDKIDTGIHPVATNSLPTGKITAVDLNGDGRDDLMFPLAQPVSGTGSPIGFVLTPKTVAQLAGRGDSGIPSAGGCGALQCTPTPGTEQQQFLDFSQNDLKVTDFGLSGYPTVLFPTIDTDHSDPSKPDGVKYFNYAFLQATAANGARPAPGASDITFSITRRLSQFPSLPDNGYNYNWSTNVYIGDFDGDGLPDVLRPNHLTQNSGNVLLYSRNTGADVFGTGQLFTPFSTLVADLGQSTQTVLQVQDDTNIYLNDFDGDGKSELLFRPESVGGQSYDGTRMYVTNWADPSTGVTGNTWQLSLLGSDKKAQSVRYQFADVNGDGLVDAIEIPNAGGDVRIAFNTGRDFLPPVSLGLVSSASGSLNPLVDQSMDKLDNTNGSATDPGLRVVDFDGNGRADLMLLGKGCFNDGSAKVFSGTTVSPTPRSSPLIVQMNGTPGLGFSLVTPTFDNGSGGTAVPVGTSSYDSNTKISGGCGGGYGASQVLDVNGDGMADFLQVENGTIVLYVRRVINGKPGLLQKVTDGLGHTTSIVYSSIANTDVHTPVQCSYPQYCGVRGSWIVSSHTFDAATDAELKFTHTYSGARLNMVGLGALGMDSHTVTDTNTHATFTNSYDHVSQLTTNIYPLRMPVSRTEVYTLGSGQTVTKQTTIPTPTLQVTNNGQLSSIAYLETNYTETEKTKDGSPATKRKVVTKSWFDETYGYLTKNTTETGTAGGTADEMTSWQPTFYAAMPDSWLVGLTDREVVTSTMPARDDLGTPASTTTRTVEFLRDVSSTHPTGAVNAVVIEPDKVDSTKTEDVSVHLTTSFVRNSTGQVTQTTETTLDGQSRTKSVDYDSLTGIFPTRVTNALGMTSTALYHPGLGVLLEAVDANGKITSMSYDGFGRARSVQRPDGSQTTMTYDKSSYPEAMATTVRGNDNITTEYYDFRGLRVRADNLYDSYGASEVLTVYDAHGRLWKKTRPYNATARPGDPDGVPQYTTYLYDEMGRPSSITGPKATKSWSYQMNSVTFKVVGDDTTQNDTSEFDQSGRLIKKSEWVQPPGGTGHNVQTIYGYEPFGSLNALRDANGNRLVAFYDLRGRRTTLGDPDVGIVLDTYDAFGQHTSHTSGQNLEKKTQQYHFDALGRLTDEIDSDGSSTYTWDVAANGVGLLAASSSKYTGPQVGGLTANTVLNSYEYDSRGRLSAQIVETMDDSYRLDYGYDSMGRRQSITYPTASGSRYQVQFNYKAGYGYLQSVTDSSQTLWTINQRNAALNITSESFGDQTTGTRGYEPERGLPTSVEVKSLDGNEVLNVGYSYNTRGYLKSRTNFLGTETETFNHDELGRLTHWASAEQSSWSADYSYDDIGNMTGLSQTAFQAGSQQKTFTPGDGIHAGPHAVSKIATTLPDGTVKTDNYGYDSMGQQISGPNRTVGYTDFGLPRQINKDTGEQWGFLYDANHQRVIKAGPTRTILYVGALYEKRITSDGVLHVMYVPGERGPVAQVTQVEGSTDRKIEYLHGDHLGSTSAITSTGNSATIMRFEPFGARTRL